MTETDQKKTFSKALMTADKPDANGRIFPRETLEKAIADAQQRVKDGQMLGTLDCSTDRIRLAEVSHRVTSLRMEGDSVVAEVVAIDNERGKLLQEILKNGTPRLSPMGYGDVDGEMKVTGYSFSAVHADPHDIEPNED